MRIAVLVDRIERMAEIAAIHPLPHAFSGRERVWYRGLAYLDDQVIPVMNPKGFLTAEEFQQLDRTVGAGVARHEMEGAVQG
jgi:chemotaxis signal transduction protein